MSKKDELYVLIKSLTKSEKRYFKIQCGKTVKTPEYLSLFQAIDQQVVYDETLIKKRFEAHDFIRQLHVTKHYLRALILKNLRNFHAHQSKDAELKDTLRNVEILFNKELYFNCETELKKAERLAERFELNSGQYEVLIWKRKLAQARQSHNFEVLGELVEEQEKVLERMQEVVEHWDYSIKASRALLQNQGTVPEAPRLKGAIERAPALEVQVLRHNTQYLRSLSTSNAKGCLDSLYGLLEVLRGDPVRLKEAPGWYVSTLNNLLSYLVYLKNYEEALELIQQAKAFYGELGMKSENKTLLKQMLRTFNIELEIYRASDIYSANLPFIEATGSFVELNMNKMPKSYQISFMFQLAYIFFKKRELSRSLHWINLALNNRLKEIRTDLQIQVRLLNLMVHFEQKNLFVLLYFVGSTQRFIKKQRPILPYEQALFKFFIKVSKLPAYERRSEPEKLRDLLFPIDADSIIPESTRGYIDYRSWLEKHIKKT